MYSIINYMGQYCIHLTHWGRVTHLCVGNLTIIGSDNGLSPGRRHAIICTNAGILLIGSLGTNFSDILIEILTTSFNNKRFKVSSAKWRPFCLGLNVLMQKWYITFKNVHVNFLPPPQEMVEVEFGVTTVLAELSMCVCIFRKATLSICMFNI